MCLTAVVATCTVVQVVRIPSGLEAWMHACCRAGEAGGGGVVMSDTVLSYRYSWKYPARMQSYSVGWALAASYTQKQRARFERLAWLHRLIRRGRVDSLLQCFRKPESPGWSVSVCLVSTYI